MKTKAENSATAGRARKPGIPVYISLVLVILVLILLQSLWLVSQDRVSREVRTDVWRAIPLPVSCELEFPRYYPFTGPGNLTLHRVDRDDPVIFASRGNHTPLNAGNAGTMRTRFLFPGWYLKTARMNQEELLRTRVLLTLTLTLSVLLLVLLLAELVLLSRRTPVHVRGG